MIVMNVHDIESAMRLMSRTAAHVYMLTEINADGEQQRQLVAISSGRGYHCVFAKPNRTGPPSMRQKSRAAIIYRKDIQSVGRKQWAGGVSSSLRFGRVIEIATAYIRPTEEAQDLQDILEDLKNTTGDRPLIFAGDFNVTTNAKGIRAHPWVVNVTPAEPNFERTNAGTRPSAVLLNAKASTMDLNVKVLPKPGGVGDGHRPIEIRMGPTSDRPLSVRRLMRVPNTLEDILEVPKIRTEPWRGKMDDGLEAVLEYAADGTRVHFEKAKKHLAKLLIPTTRQYCRRTLQEVRRRLRERRPAGRDQPSLPWKDRIIPKIRAGAPTAVMEGNTLKTDFESVERGFTSFWKSIWTSAAASGSLPKYIFPRRAEVEEAFQKDITAEEIREVAGTLKGRKSTADYWLGDVRRILEGATDQELTQAFTRSAFKDKPVISHVLLAPKGAVNTRAPRDHRPLGSVESSRTITARVMLHRAEAQKIEWHPSNYTFRKNLATTDPAVAFHAAAARYAPSMRGVYANDVHKAYDVLIHQIIDDVLKMFGMYNEYTAYTARRIYYVLVYAKGTSEHLRAVCGLIQGDPLSILVFRLVAEVLCRYIDTQTQILLYAQFVDDFHAFVFDRIEVRKIHNLVVGFWRGIGAKVGKFRIISTEDWTETTVEQEDGEVVSIKHDHVGRVLGCCLHLSDRMGKCEHATEVAREATRRIENIWALTYNSVRRALLMHWLVVPVIVATSSPCILPAIKKEGMQERMNATFTRGMQNRSVSSMGLQAGYHVSVGAGGRHIPDIEMELQLHWLRIVRMAASAPTMGRDTILRACRHNAATAHPANILRLWSAAMGQYGLELVTERSEPLWIPGGDWRIHDGRTCCDASFKRETGQARVGIATRSGGIISKHTVGLSGAFRSSFEAEMAGAAFCAIGRSGGPLIGVYNDNMGGCRHLARLHACHPAMHPRMVLGNQAAGLALTAATAIRLMWVKGHVESDLTPEQELNVAADEAAAADLAQDDVVYPKGALETRVPGMYTRNGEILTKLNDLKTDSREALKHRWSEITPMEVVQGDSIAFYYSPKGGHFTLGTAELETLMAVRMRTLFTIRGRKRTCRCGSSIDSRMDHVVFDCTLAAHGTTPQKLYEDLTRTQGPGWWSPDCLLRGKCECLGAGPQGEAMFTCTHRSRGLAPKRGVPNRMAQAMWARYLHARVEVCHPSNARDQQLECAEGVEV